MKFFVLTPVALAGTLAVTMLASLPARADSNADPPMGIVMTSTTLAQVLHMHKMAVGEAPKSATATTEKWLYAEGELSGTKTVVTEGDDYREDTQLGPFHAAFGNYHGQQWEQNENGLTVFLTGIHRRNEVNDNALRHATALNSGVTLLGTVGVPQPSFLVKVAPPGGRVEYIFYDEKSYLITRTERAVVDQRVVTTYDDYRTTDGVTRAWHIHESDGRPFNETDWKLQSIDNATPVDSSVFHAPPSDTSHFALNNPKVVLPGKIISDVIILTAQIGRHKVDFQLDSGASQILLDKSVADALGLPAFGKSTETTAGTYTATRSIVPRIDFGGAALTNVAVMTAPFFQWADESTPIAGLLGFDFIANCVVHVDYEHGEVDALDAATFQPPAGALAIPVRLDDHVPTIAATISDTVSDRFILDTGADNSMLFSEFITQHPGASSDQGLGEIITEAYPFFDEMVGVGGKLKVSKTQVSSLAVGSAKFPRWLFSVLHGSPAFEDEDVDGLIGQDVLRNFDIYLDYPSSKIYFVPNDRYRERWAS